MRYEFTTTPAPTVALVLGRGRIEITGVAGIRTVTVDVDGEGVVAEQRRQAIAVRQERHRQGAEDATVHLTVPAGTTLVGRTAVATITQHGTLGTVRLQHGTGTLSLGRIAETLVAKTGAGDITVEEVGGSAVLQSGAGRIELGRAGGSSRIATGVGDIEVGRLDAVADLKTGAGGILVRRASADLTLRSGSGPMEVLLFDGEHLTARNHSGAISVGIPEGRPVWRDVVTVTGQLVSTLPPTGEPAKGTRHAEIRAVTRHGDVTLRPAEEPAA
ncbi:MAG: DUF4097 family beta strand repeat-containing protein [Nocardioides sp.]|uniref:DUF4097 family beta strand repeat-containing protein n=1 Tax=Nocardioides sp. TaxID=35761 RepID=UPI0039E45AC7